MNEWLAKTPVYYFIPTFHFIVQNLTVFFMCLCVLLIQSNSKSIGLMRGKLGLAPYKRGATQHLQTSKEMQNWWGHPQEEEEENYNWVPPNNQPLWTPSFAKIVCFLIDSSQNVKKLHLKIQLLSMSLWLNLTSKGLLSHLPSQRYWGLLSRTRKRKFSTPLL